MPNFWPPDFGKGDVNPPVAILREQADYLAQVTKGDLLAFVQTGRDESHFVHSFILRAPLLDNYRYHLFTVTHPLELYPVDVVFHATSQSWQGLPNQATLENVLKEIMQSDATRNIVQALLSQSEAIK